MLPYREIGIVTVWLLGVVAALALSLFLYAVLYAAWWRWWRYVSKIMWWGYDATEPHAPPLWRRRIAVFAQCMKLRKWSFILEAQRRVTDSPIDHDDESMIEWARRVFDLGD